MIMKSWNARYFRSWELESRLLSTHPQSACSAAELTSPLSDLAPSSPCTVISVCGSASWLKLSSGVGSTALRGFSSQGFTGGMGTGTGGDNIADSFSGETSALEICHGTIRFSVADAAGKGLLGAGAHFDRREARNEQG